MPQSTVGAKEWFRPGPGARLAGGAASHYLNSHIAGR